jgi:hypothetical protein
VQRDDVHPIFYNCAATCRQPEEKRCSDMSGRIGTRANRRENEHEPSP